MKVALITPRRFDFLRTRFGLGCALLIALVSASCTYLVDPESREIKCQATDANPNPCASPLVCIEGRCVDSPACDDVRNPCPTGLLCQAGACVDPMECEPLLGFCNDKKDNDCNGQVDEPNELNVMIEPETCGDKKDNDCDGEIDEGHDEDEDGNQWCGDTTVPGGNAMGDCDEKDPTIYYGAPEICDGRDNNCDGQTDEPTPDKSLCGAGEECIGRCVVPSCVVQGSSVKCRPDEMCDSDTGKCIPSACGLVSCAADEFCDPTTGICTSSKKPNGTACNDHAECVSGSCVESESLGLNVSAVRVCAQACCGDAECGPNQRCFSPGTGARSCMPLALVPRGAETGITCSLTAQCLAGEVCGLEHRLDVQGSIIDTDTLVSGAVCLDEVPEPSKLAVGERCGSDEAPLCDARVCVAQSFTQYGTNYVCTNVCGSSKDCAGLGAAVTTGQGAYCRIVRAPEGYVPFCVLQLSASEVGPGDTGEPCVDGGDCLDGACVRAADGSGVCASTCCNDSQCGLVAGQQTHCRPVAFGAHFEPRCVL